MPSLTKDEKKALDAKAFEAVKVGDIFVESWGYDQTNVDFYEVVAKTAARIKIVHIGAKIVEGNGGPSEKVVPVPGHPVESALESKKGVLVKQVRAITWRGGDAVEPIITMSSYSSATLWDGKPEYQTGACFGR